MDELRKRKISRGGLRSDCKTIQGSRNELVEGGMDFSKAVELKSLKMNFEDIVAKLKAVADVILLPITEEGDKSGG